MRSCYSGRLDETNRGDLIGLETHIDDKDDASRDIGKGLNAAATNDVDSRRMRLRPIVPPTRLPPPDNGPPSPRGAAAAAAGAGTNDGPLLVSSEVKIHRRDSDTKQSTSGDHKELIIDMPTTAATSSSSTTSDSVRGHVTRMIRHQIASSMTDTARALTGAIDVSYFDDRYATCSELQSLVTRVFVHCASTIYHSSINNH
jgi:hypothetical protein